MAEAPFFDETGFNTLWLILNQESLDRDSGDRVSRDRLEPKVKALAPTGATDNLALEGASVLHFTGGTAFDLSGFVAPDPDKARLLILYVSGAGTVTLKQEATSAAANRLRLISGADTALATAQGTIFVYLSSRWRQVI